jgi:hypothetical protein
MKLFTIADVEHTDVRVAADDPPEMSSHPCTLKCLGARLFLRFQPLDHGGICVVRNANLHFDKEQHRRPPQTVRLNLSTFSRSTTDQQLIADARSRWQNTVAGLQDAMRVQAGVVGNIDTNRAEMAALVGQSQGATGALQATQAGNQLLALQAQQLADLTAVVAANGRAQALSDAERAAAAEQGREQRRRFLTPGTGYQPGNARMFPGGN